MMVRVDAPAMSRIADVMTADALTATVGEPLDRAAARMAEHGVGSVVVVEGNHPIGILTERDLLRAAAAAIEPAHVTVGEWMTPDPECLDADAEVEDAWQRLTSRRFRHLPAVTDGELQGIVSMRDLVAIAQLRPATAPPLVAPPGLKGVIVAETVLGDVRGAEGFYHYRQHPAPVLAATRGFEDVWALMVDGALPEPGDRRFADEVAALRAVPADVAAALPAIARAARTPEAALRTAVSLLAGSFGLAPSLDAPAARLRDEALRLCAPVPALVAALHRLRHGLEPVAPDPSLPHVTDYLRMVHGELPSAAHARAVEQYFVLALEHGFNASTFTTRVVTSTGADLGSALVAGLGALSGPLHGGAIAETLDTMDAIGVPERAHDWVRAEVVAGRTIMGFGHPVYRTADPRSLMLRSIAESFGGQRVEVAVAVEAAVEEVLAELKPGRELHTNVEWYAAVVLELCGLPRSLFTSTFMASRIVGWSAQAMEQAADNRIIRPSARYVGPEVSTA
jgi:citrate synthase